MTTAARIRQLINAACSQAVFGGHHLEGVAQRGSGFGAHVNSRHVTADTVGKGVDGMCVFVGVAGMTGQTLAGSGPHGLKLCRRKTQLVDIVT